MKPPERGEVWLVDLGLAAKVRPCLVISIPAADEDRAIATVIPHTTSLRGSRFEVAVQKRFLRHGGFDAQNPITVPHAKFIRRLGSLNVNDLALVEQTVKLWLGISQ
jgi:mRNA interferase MazF